MTMAPNYDLVPPDPGALIESLRAFGYTPESALADLVDNSITAGARRIDVKFLWDGAESRIVIADDGAGMTDSALQDAMRAGSTNPREARTPDDLGRFGLGLKTASFSQCRILTVISKSARSRVSCRRWDLDEVARTSEWRLLRGSTTWGEVLVEQREATGRGTTVIWENLDRLVGGTDANDAAAQKHFYEIAERVSAHLSMTFHRFLTGRRLTISVDGVPVAKWDPFLEGNSARQVLGTELLTYSGGVVEVDPYVLPHRSKLSDEDFKVGGGKRGWNDLQGFFVYRNQRLLVAGDWLGLRFTKEEHYKLARIRVDLPNDVDELWQIDVRKSVAVPPAEIRGELTRIAKVTRERAVEVYRYRGKVLSRRASQGVIPLWQERVRHGRVSYAINTDHEAVASALREPTSKSVRTLLKLIEETIPVPLIAINSSEKPTLHSTPLEDLTPRIVSDLATEIYRSFRASGLSHREAVGRVMSTDPFHLHPELHEVLNALAGTKKETA